MNKLITRFAASLLLLALAQPFVFAQQLSADEQKIVQAVDAHQNEAIVLLEKVVNIPSATQNLAGVKQVGQVFKSEFESLGFATRWIEMPPEMKRAGHLVAEHKGTKGKRVLLLGHVDTVLEGEAFRRDGKRAFGTGTSDMKAGDVVLLYAVKALHDAGLLKDTQIIVMLTGDEEASGHPHEVSRGDMFAAAKRSDLALSFEGAVRNTGTVGRRGSSSWTLEVTGKTGHSAGIFGERMGSGAIFEAARILDAFYQQLHGEKYLTFNPSVIVGGTEAELKSSSGTANGKTNVVAQRVVVKGDLRFISEEQKAAARQKMREIVAQNLPQTSAKITFEDGIPAMFPRKENYALLEQMSRVSEDLGFGKVEALDPGERGAGDVAYIADIIPGLDGLGAKGTNAHAPGEAADLESLPMLIKRTAVLLYRLTR